MNIKIQAKPEKPGLRPRYFQEIIKDQNVLSEILLKEVSSQSNS